MLRKTPLALLALLLVAVSAMAGHKGEVFFESPCNCRGNHGVFRWSEKTEAAQPPATMGLVKTTTPAEMRSWRGPGDTVVDARARIAPETQWYTVTGRVDKVKLEDDGDLHLELSNVDGRPGRIVVELPLGPPWCELRTVVFGWTEAAFPIAQRRLHLREHPVITVTGKAFFDTIHAGPDRTANARGHDAQLAVWEIHPVMKLAVLDHASAVAQKNDEPGPEVPALPLPEKAVAAEYVTLTKAIPLRIPYGTTVLQAGTRLPVLSRNDATARVRYLEESYDIPLALIETR